MSQILSPTINNSGERTTNCIAEVRDFSHLTACHLEMVSVQSMIEVSY